jgi:hypothetical protein
MISATIWWRRVLKYVLDTVWRVRNVPGWNKCCTGSCNKPSNNDAAAEDGLKARTCKAIMKKSATSHLKENIWTISYTVWRIKMQNIKK